MLAIEMKAMGCFVCRGLSYTDAEFELVQSQLSTEQRKLFDRAATFWSDRLLPAVLAAAQRTGAAAGVLTRAYWGVHQRFFKQLCVALKVPALVERVHRALHEGQSVVIGLQVCSRPGRFDHEPCACTAAAHASAECDVT